MHIGPPTLLGVGVAAGDQGADVPGVIMREALRGGPAEQAGLVDGDVLPPSTALRWIRRPR